MPIAPVLMTPAYRFGAATPWGGDGLRAFFHKDIPDGRTGESLEASAIPGLESRSEEGETLTALIGRYGERLTGKGFAHPFPLLLKLLDARDTLSVQVHPDNEYAARVEHKLGKTEAWHILRCDEGAELVYGLTPGVTKEELRAACREGSRVEGMLRRVKVHPGETYYIPAGTVHAIGRGILLYEIQQSSDVTYRFYDWNRTDKAGNKRELHLDKAIDVTRLDFCGEAAREEKVEEGHFALLREKYFWLDRFAEGVFALPRDEARFGILTATAPCVLSWQGGEMVLPAGRTALLPADGFDLRLQCGAALLSRPARDECAMPRRIGNGSAILLPN